MSDIEHGRLFGYQCLAQVSDYKMNLLGANESLEMTNGSDSKEEMNGSSNSEHVLPSSRVLTSPSKSILKNLQLGRLRHKLLCKISSLQSINAPSNGSNNHANNMEFDLENEELDERNCDNDCYYSNSDGYYTDGKNNFMNYVYNDDKDQLFNSVPNSPKFISSLRHFSRPNCSSSFSTGSSCSTPRKRMPRFSSPHKFKPSFLTPQLQNKNQQPTSKSANSPQHSLTRNRDIRPSPPPLLPPPAYHTIPTHILSTHQHYSPTMSRHQYKGKPAHNLLDLENQSLSSNLSQIYLPSSSVPYQEIREICVRKESKEEPFGFCIEKIGSAIFITSITPSSPSSRAGLKIGDEIVRLNNKSILNCTNPSLIIKQKNSSQQEPLKLADIARSTGNTLVMSYKPRLIFVRLRDVILRKSEGRIGIRLQRRDEGLFISIVVADSPAFKAGLREGDELLKINDEVVSDWSQEQATQYLRQIGADESDLLLIIKEFLPMAHVTNFPNTTSTNQITDKNCNINLAIQSDIAEFNRICCEITNGLEDDDHNNDDIETANVILDVYNEEYNKSESNNSNKKNVH